MRKDFCFKIVNHLGKAVKLYAKRNQTVLQVLKSNKIDIGPNCAGQLCCGRCRIDLPPALYDKSLGPSIKERDVLDKEYNITDYSRLGCQILVSKNFTNQLIRVANASI